MNKLFKNILSYLLAILICISLLVVATNITENKMSDYKYNDFFNEKNNFDVLFLGSSHVVNGILPMELWNDYGIVSYNLGGHGTQIPTTYWILKNALDYTKPKLVVIDGYLLSHDYKTSEKYKYVHYSLDAFPLTVNKVKTALDLTNDSKMKELIENNLIENESRTKMELLWNFSIYHSRWNDLTEDDFINPSSPMKGAEINNNLYSFDIISENSNEVVESETQGIIYLEKMIKFCKEESIEVLLVYLPVSSDFNGCYRENNRMYEIAKDNDVKFISFMDNIITDKTSDFADDASHLNYYGAVKVTNYIGEYIINNYNINDRRKDTNYISWYDDYKKYLEYKEKCLNAN